MEELHGISHAIVGAEVGLGEGGQLRVVLDGGRDLGRIIFWYLSCGLRGHGVSVSWVNVIFDEVAC